MITDQELTFSDAQALTATANSTNIIDLSPLTGNGPLTNQYRDIGAGMNLWLVFTVTVAFTDVSSDSTVTASLTTDTDVAFGTPVTIRTFDVFAALTPAGTQRKYRLEPALYERYLRLTYTLAGGSLTTGSITAQIVIDVESRRDYVSGYDSSVT